MIRRVEIEFIPHGSHRYPTCGDYFYTDPATLVVRVSQMEDWRSELAVAIHELIESFACHHAGIEEPNITAFDIEFEKNRKPDDLFEPGDDPGAPYHEQHQLATKIERELIESIGPGCAKHDELIQALFE